MNNNFMKDEDIILTKAKADGMKEMWDTFKFICLEPEDGGMPKTDLIKIFNKNMDDDIYGILDELFLNYSPKEVVRKVQIWKRTSNLKMGDEVASIDNSEVKGVVLHPNEKGSQAVVLTIPVGNPDELTFVWWSKSAIEKTGKFYPELSQIFEKLRGAAAHD